MLYKKTRGQSLIEIIVALTVGVVLVGGVSTLIGLNIRTSYDAKTIQAATALAQEVSDKVKSVAEADWHNIYNLNKGSTYQYFISTTTPSIVINSGAELISSDGKNFNRYFYVENVNRTNCGMGDITTNAATSCDTAFPTSGVGDDPLTQKITVVVLLNGTEILRQIEFLIRSKNVSVSQMDWSGGSGQLGPTANVGNKFYSSSNIDSTSTPGWISVSSVNIGSSTGYLATGYGWNDNISWVDFSSPGTAKVFTDHLGGYANSSVGYIALDCATSPNGNICGSSNFKVYNNGTGSLSGWAWNDGIGWISFDSVGGGSTYPYNVSIDSSGNFHGWAWNDNIGWISFNCDNTSCPPNYSVTTSWSNPSSAIGTLDSSIFDTGSNLGAALNSVIWQGDPGTSGSVYFQIASSNNPVGPWNFVGPANITSPDCSLAGSCYTGSVNQTIPVNIRLNNNVRYFRYRALLKGTAKVDSVVVNYSL